MSYNQSCLRENKRAAEGVGTLIIFIALILVAAVAAGVLISTSAKLQGKAEVTGTQIKERISTGFTIVQVGAHGTEDGEISINDTIEVRIQLAPGSEAIGVGDVTISLITEVGAGTFEHIDFPNSLNSSDLSLSFDRGSGEDGYINKDDVATFSLRNKLPIAVREEFQIILYPGNGQAQIVYLVTPQSFTKRYTSLK